MNSTHHPHSLGYATNSPNFAGGKAHTVRIVYLPGPLRVHLDNMAEPLLNINVDPAKVITLDQSKAWLGFMAGTGNAYGATDILSWSASIR